MPAEGVKLTERSKILTTDEIIKLASLFVEQGVTKIRLTGGEPTVRKDIVHLIECLRKLPGLENLAMTTNGIVLTRHLSALQKAGLDSLNISLDTLKPDRFEMMTRRKGWERVIAGIDLATQLGYQRLKVNCVVMRGVNDDEILDFVDFTRDRPVDIRFIEYMPFTGNKWNDKKLVSLQEMLSIIREKYPSLSPLSNQNHDTSKAYKVPDFKGQIGFISSMTDNFCGTCNRLRLMADGSLKVCLFGNSEISLRDMLRSGVSKDDMLTMIQVAVLRKKRQHADGSAAKHLSKSNLAESKCLRKFPSPIKGIINNLPCVIPYYQAKKSAECQRDKIIRRLAVCCINEKYTINFKTYLKNQCHEEMRKPGLEREGVMKSALFTNPLSINKKFHQRLQLIHLYHSKRDDGCKSGRLTHINSEGKASMVDVSDKSISKRSAIAQCVVVVGEELTKLIKENQVKKGDVLTVAQLAGIIAAKKTSELIPLCHNISLTKVDVRAELDESILAVVLRSEVRCEGKTGVEIEALTAVAVAGLTVYDMCKAVSKHIILKDIKLLSKSGGLSGDFSSVEMEK